METPTAPTSDLQPPARASAPAKSSSSSSALGLLSGGNKKGGDQFLDISADESLEWHENESMYIARGHAIAKRGDLTVEADLLKAYNRKKPDGSSEVWKLEAEGNVKLSDPKHTATGEHGVYDIDSKTATLTGKNLTFKTDTDTITARDSFVYSENDSQITANGNVHADREGRRVTSDQMVAWLAPNKTGGQDIDRLEAKHNVHIVTKDDAVTCEDAIYNVAKNTATLTGKVHITRGQNQLKGDKVEADFTSGKSRLINTGSGRVSALIVGSQGGKPGSAPQRKTVMPVLRP